MIKNYRSLIQPLMIKKYDIKLHPLILVMLFFFTCACNRMNKEKTEKTQTGKETKSLIIKKPGSGFNDTLVIKSNSAVFYVPDTVQMGMIKKVNNKDVFDLLTHNCHYQMQYSREAIKKYWPHIKIIETYKHRYLLFEKLDKEKKCIDLDEKNDICGLFLFDGKKDPVLADMPNIDTQLSLYFSR